MVTFLLARVCVLLIMTHRMPNLYLHMGGTHVHPLNYGIFILSAAGAILLFRRPQGRALKNIPRLHWRALVVLGAALLGLGILGVDSWRFASTKLSPIFQQIEAGGPE